MTNVFAGALYGDMERLRRALVLRTLHCPWNGNAAATYMRIKLKTT